MSVTQEDVAALLQGLEESLLRPAIRRDSEAVERLLADDFREFGSSGRSSTKQQILAELAAESPRRITFSSFECRLISPDAALVTYRSESELGTALRSSIWVLRDGRWQMLFHQGTRLPAEL